MSKILMRRILLVWVVFVMACGAGARPEARVPVTGSSPPGFQGPGYVPEGPRGDEAAARSVIRSATLTLEAKETEAVVARVLALAPAYGGYVVDSSTKHASIRVDAARFDAALEEIAKFAELKEKKVSGQDVTDYHRDLQIRLDNAERARERYLALLAKAENVQAALQVERELERLVTQIDLLKGQKQRLEEQVRLSLITVRVETPVRPGPVGWVFYGLYKALEWLFVWD